MAKGKIKHKFPSQVRYEQSHPVVSCRVSREVYSKLENIKKVTGKSFADIVKEAIGVQKRGKRFQVYIGFCSICGKPLFWDLSQPEHQELLAKAIHNFGMHHTACESSR